MGRNVGVKVLFFTCLKHLSELSSVLGFSVHFYLLLNPLKNVRNHLNVAARSEFWTGTSTNRTRQQLLINPNQKTFLYFTHLSWMWLSYSCESNCLLRAQESTTIKKVLPAVFFDWETVCMLQASIKVGLWFHCEFISLPQVLSLVWFVFPFLCLRCLVRHICWNMTILSSSLPSYFREPWGSRCGLEPKLCFQSKAHRMYL